MGATLAIGASQTCATPDAADALLGLETPRLDAARLRPAVVRLAARAAYNLIDQHDRARQLVAGEMAAREIGQLGVIDRLSLTRLDHGGHLLAEALVGSADDDGVIHRRVPPEHLLHLLGVDLLPAGVDAHRSAAEHVDRAVAVEARVVARHRVAHAADGGER